jgi:hypothetical protein
MGKDAFIRYRSPSLTTKSIASGRGNAANIRRFSFCAAKFIWVWRLYRIYPLNPLTDRTYHATHTLTPTTTNRTPIREFDEAQNATTPFASSAERARSAIAFA